jgi:NADH-quinone oxidoreductase subunit E
MSSLQQKFEELSRTYPPQMRPSLVLPLLQHLQEEKGYLTEDDAHAVAACTGVPPMQAIEVLTWYTMLYRKPVGRHVIKVCRNIACSLRGAERLIDHLQQKLGVAVGETTSDGRFTLLTVECLASCGAAPSMQIDDTHHDCLNEASIDRILEGMP